MATKKEETKGGIADIPGVGPATVDKLLGVGQ